MRQSLAGNQRAYTSLLHKTTRLLRPFLAKRLNIANEVNDLMQEILLSIHKARHTYDGNRPYTSRVYADELEEYLLEPVPACAHHRSWGLWPEKVLLKW